MATTRATTIAPFGQRTISFEDAGSNFPSAGGSMSARGASTSGGGFHSSLLQPSPPPAQAASAYDPTSSLFHTGAGDFSATGASQASPYSLRLPSQSFASLAGGSASARPSSSGGSLPSTATSSHHTRFYYKLVAKVGPNRFVSIYDGETDYVLGQTMRAPIRNATSSSSTSGSRTARSNSQSVTSCKYRDETQGGIFVCRSAEEALEARLPDNAALYCAPRALLKVMAWGDTLDYGSTLAFSFVRPVQAYPLSLSNLNTAFGSRTINAVKLAETRNRLPPFNGPKRKVLPTFREREEMGVLTRQIMHYDRTINLITRRQLGQ